MCQEWLSILANLAQLIGIPIAAVALVLAVRQLKVAAETAARAEATAMRAEAASEAQAVLALDQLLNQERFEKLREELNKGKVSVPNNNIFDPNAIELRRYTAAFERLGNLVDRGVVSLVLADELYGSRIEKLLQNAPYVKAMVAPDNVGKPAWRNFISLWNKIDACRNLETNPPETPTSHTSPSGQ
ncbi:hypothetical protein [Geodermatophilus sp. URMC 63]